MREIQPSGAFKRDLRREKKGRYRVLLEKELSSVADTLAEDKPLPYRYHDHPLHGNFEGFRECHIRPDFLLVYRYEGDDLLILERLGSHSEIFGL